MESVSPTVLLLVDGMRPDALTGCGNPFVPQLIRQACATLQARTVLPAVTLPCHMSLFHSVTPQRHGVLTNQYVPQARPVVGLAEQLSLFGKKTAFFYTWEALRDLSRPDSLCHSLMINQEKLEDTDRKITREAIRYLNEERPDFLFLYLGQTDQFGHDFGWMTEPQLACVNQAVDRIREVWEALPPGGRLIVTADHGGHDRSHGEDVPEDTTIPLLCLGDPFPAGRALPQASILDLAPTIARLCQTPPARQWEGRSLI